MTWYDLQLHVSPSAPEQLEPCVESVVNRSFYKPTGGLWTATYRVDEHSSSWVDWCRVEEFGNVDACNWFILEPDPTANVYIIDSADDLTRLGARYSVGFFLDFEELARQYDAIHLTDDGQWATRHTRPGLYGWDVESTLWFRWRFKKVERVAVNP